MHPRVAEAFEQIDAALFNGDTFDDPENEKHLFEYLGRWLRKSKYPLDLLLRDDEPDQTSKDSQEKREHSLKLARQHIEGHDRDKDDDYPECWMCNELMERGDSEPSAFCATCIYTVADVLAESVESLDTALTLTKNSREVNYKRRRELEEQLSSRAESGDKPVRGPVEKLTKRSRRTS